MTPGYAKKYMGRVFRTNAEVVGVDKKGRECKLAANSRVLVTGYHQAEGSAPDEGHCLILVRLRRSGRFDPRDITYDGATPSLLEPEPGVAEWPHEFSLQALGQGWDIFFRDEPNDDNECFELQAWVLAGRFDGDQDAWAFVWNRAVEERCPVASAALSFLYYRSPREYRRIRKHCLA